MLPPEVTPTPDGFEVLFREDAGRRPYLTLKCDHLEKTSWGIRSTVTVSTTVPTISTIPGSTDLLVSRIDLLRERDHLEMGKRISELIPPPSSAAHVDWRRHIEYAGVVINARMKAPAPSLDLITHVPSQDRRFLVDGLLARNKANVLYGPGGTGKSLMAVRFAASVHTGRHLFGYPVHETGKTLYLDWEDDEDVLSHRLGLIAAGMGIDRFSLIYKSLHGRGAYDLHHGDVLFTLQNDPDIKLVVFDSTAMAMHGMASGEGAEGAIKFHGLVSRLPATVLLLDHVSSDDIKSGDGAAKPYGSVFKVNAARNVWEVRPWDAGSLQGVDLKHRKSNVGPRQNDFGVSIQWDLDAVRMKETRAADYPIDI